MRRQMWKKCQVAGGDLPPPLRSELRHVSEYVGEEGGKEEEKVRVACCCSTF